LIKFFNKISVWLNLILAIFLIFAYISAYISPINFAFFAFFGLVYPFLLFLNLLFFAYWCFRKKKYLFISLITISIGWNFLFSFFQINFNKKNFKVDEEKIKFLSYNVRIFNLWNWSSEKNRALRTYNFIKKNNYNIVCLQEFYSNNNYGKNALDSILKNSSLKYVYVSYTKKDAKIYHHGIATFSSYPIVNKGSVQTNKNDNFCIFTDLKINEDTIRVYNLHLASIHLGYNDYQAIDNINNDTIINVKAYTNILSKLKRSYIERAHQVNTISAHISKSKYRVILAGDFNDTPFSYAYNSINKNMQDAFIQSGIGIESTYIHKFSTFRIDYIFHSASINSYNFRRLKVKLSDHYPIECFFQINFK